jgi:3-deoxy-D-manno-octulosonic-acid transferase
MYFVYSLLLTLGFLVLLPRFLIDALRHGKYIAGFGERLGSLSDLESQGRPVVWIHCVSVGESQAARPLVRALRQRFPDHLLAISTTTLTGQRLARELFKNEASKIFYFPFDWRWTVRRALKAINPAVVLILETEIWPNFLRECHSRQIPLAIVNGRISHQSFRRYKWLRAFISRVLKCLNLAVMQTEADAERIRNLGLDPEKVFVAGNLKFDAGRVKSSNSLLSELQQRFNISPERPLIVAASTHAPEERVMLDAFKRVQISTSGKIRLLLAPRHPERFADVAHLLDDSGLSWARRSDDSRPTDQTCDVILLDTIGELPITYSLATIVFVGGSISNNGGHNILEPAAIGTAIVTGAHTHNFDGIISTFAKKQAIVQLPHVSEADAGIALANVFSEMLSNTQTRLELGERAMHVVEENQGATDITLSLLSPLFLERRNG